VQAAQYPTLFHIYYLHRAGHCSNAQEWLLGRHDSWRLPSESVDLAVSLHLLLALLDYGGEGESALGQVPKSQGVVITY